MHTSEVSYGYVVTSDENRQIATDNDNATSLSRTEQWFADYQRLPRWVQSNAVLNRASEAYIPKGGKLPEHTLATVTQIGNGALAAAAQIKSEQLIQSQPAA